MQVRRRIKAARKRQALWVRALDVARLVPTAEGRARLWTRVVHANEVHQLTPFTEDDRYPELFDLAAELAPRATRILSFGCSTGEELVALRRRFPSAAIVGTDINGRSRRIATKRVLGDPGCTVLAPRRIDGAFDLIFALAVFQREPHKINETDTEDISSHYPFRRFDAAVSELVRHLKLGGFLCVTNAQYRIEDSRAFGELESVEGSPEASGEFFGSDGRRLEGISAKTFFRKNG